MTAAQDYLYRLTQQLDKHTDPDELIAEILEGLGLTYVADCELLCWELIRTRWVVLSRGTRYVPDADRVVQEMLRTLRTLRPYGAFEAWEIVRTWQGPQ